MSRIVISGLTAAGKTTHGSRLARDLNIPYYSASESFHRYFDAGSSIFERRWSPQVDAIRKKTPKIDDLVDNEMISALEAGPGVFDATLLPWLTDRRDCVFVWLDSGLLSRARKCYVSHLDDIHIDLGVANDIVFKKDMVTIDRLSSVKGVPFFPDHRLFHVIISNDDTLPHPTFEDAQLGILDFHPVFRASVRYALGLDGDKPESPWVLHLRTLV
jgi:cytidylate kinase